MIPAGLLIGCVGVAIAILVNQFFPKQDLRWFMRLRRPRWLTFEWAIPLIWISIFICSGGSAYHTWENSGLAQGVGLMVGYALLEILILLYTPIMCKCRSLTVGTIIGGVGFLWGLVLAALVAQISMWGLVLLLPYLLWSPVGTYVTWQMIGLNPGNA